MATVVDVSPVVKTIEVARSADDAFVLFVNNIDAWWPKETHSRARSALGQFTAKVTIEPRLGGIIYETLKSGEEMKWGDVLAYEPGRRFAMSWQVPPREDGLWSEVEVRFEPLGAQRCRVTLTHSGWDKLPDGAKSRESYENGWVAVFEQRFGTYANAPA